MGTHQSTWNWHHRPIPQCVTQTKNKNNNNSNNNNNNRRAFFKNSKTQTMWKNNLFSCSCVRNEVAIACTLLHLIFRSSFSLNTHFTPVNHALCFANKLQTETRKLEIRPNVCLNAYVCASVWVVNCERCKRRKEKKGYNVV